MVNYFLHRVPQGESVIDTLDYTGSGAATARPGDCFIVYESHTLAILGAFALTQGLSVRTIAVPKSPITIKDFFSKFSFIHTVNEQTVRMFKKKNRIITQADYDMMIAAFG